MKVLGITGSSGSGKTKISEIFYKFDDTIVYNADKLVKEFDTPKSKYLLEIEDYFGKDVILENGFLNRKKMSQLISKNSDYRTKLNEITKKNLLPIILELIEKNSDKKLVIFDIPILFENKIEKYCDKVLVVISEKEIQIKRICKRDNISEKQAIERLEMQQKNEFYIENADYVIYNIEKTDEELEQEVEKIYLDIIRKEIK